MKRRNFLATAATATLAGLNGCMDGNTFANDDRLVNIQMIGGLDLKQLKERYRKALFDQFIPNMDKYVIDHELGGFMTSVDIRTGKQLSTDKRAWYEGRGIWVYSFLYNNFEKDSKFLEIARKSKEFILKQQPTDNSFWNSSYTREGKPLTVPGYNNPYISESGDIYGDLFIAEGLAEYSKASGEEEYFALAKKITLECLAKYDQPDYSYDIVYGPLNAPKIQGTRVLGHWMIFLRTVTQMLEMKPDSELEKLAERCVDAVMNHHLNSDYSLLNEGLEHDLSLPNNEWAQFAYLGHGIETLWMVMSEASRRKDKKLLIKSMDAFKRHVRLAYDGVYGGYFRSLDHVDNSLWTLNKMLLFQQEILIGTLFMIEHTGDQWARQCFAETEEYVRKKFTRPDFKFWIPNGNRTVSEFNTSRAEHYHHPRYLMLNLLAIDRMIKRNGKVSNLLS